MITRTPTIPSMTPKTSALTQLQKVTTKGVNPLFFKNSIDRQAATLAKAQRIMASPAYKTLSPDKQKALREDYYNRTVVPAYKGAGYSIPDKATWVEGVTKTGFNPSDYYLSTSTRQALTMLAGSEEVSGQIFHGALSAGVWINKQALHAQLGLSQFFGGTNSLADNQKVELQGKAIADKAQQNINRISNDTILAANFWQQTHPTKNFVSKVDTIIGESLIELPLYETIAQGRALMAGKNLTKALSVASPTAKLVAHTLGNASDAFIGSMIEGQSKEEAEKNMAAWMGWGAVGHIAGSAITKAFLSKTTAMGGKPLVQAITDEAEKELNEGSIHGHVAPADVKIEPKHVTEALYNAHTEDPIKTKLVTSSKVILNSIAQSNFKKSFKELSTVEKNKVRALHNEVTQQAITELPVHNPDIAKANASQAVQFDISTNPFLAAQHEKLTKQFGVNPTESLIKAEQEAVKNQSGIKNNQGVNKKLAKSKGMKAAQKNYPEAIKTAKSIHDVIAQHIKNPGAMSPEDIEKWDKKVLDRAKAKKKIDDMYDEGDDIR